MKIERRSRRLRRHEIWMARVSPSLGLARRHKRKRHGKLIGRRRAREMCDLIKKAAPSRARTHTRVNEANDPRRCNKFSFYDEKAIKRGAACGLVSRDTRLSDIGKKCDELLYRSVEAVTIAHVETQREVTKRPRIREQPCNKANISSLSSRFKDNRINKIYAM